LTEPFDYYLVLNWLIGKTKNRISMSSLYLGNGKLEKLIIDKMEK